MIKVNDKIVEQNRYPDGTPNIKAEPIDNSVVIISWHYNDDSEFMIVSFLAQYYRSRDNLVYLFLPYIPNARMDRTKQANEVFAAKYFGRMINMLNFENVFVMDAHSSVSLAAIDKVRWSDVGDFVEQLHSLLTMRDGQEPLYFYPDEGAMKRYELERQGHKFGFGMKNRDWTTGKILSYDVCGLTEQDIAGKNVLIRDDICSKGRTFYSAAKKLKEMGADKIYLYVTHCEESIHNGKFGENNANLFDTGLIERVFTTNSIYSLPSNDKIVVFDVDAYMTENQSFGIRFQNKFLSEQL